MPECSSLATDLPLERHAHSSTYDHHLCQQGRLDTDQAWCAASNDQSQWLQLTLPTAAWVDGVATKGRSDVQEWVTSFKVSWLTSEEGWQFLQCSGSDCIFTGNADQNTQVDTLLTEGIFTSAVRLHPWTWQGRVSMRAGLFVDDDPTSSRGDVETAARAPTVVGVETAATQCASCPGGTFNEQGDASCDSCPSGQFSAAAGATNISACSGCAAGQVSTYTEGQDGTGMMTIDGEVASVALRLAGDAPGVTRGKLEMSVEGRMFWPVCSVGFGSSEAQIFCRALGYDGREAITWNTQKKASRFAAGGISCGEAASIDGCSANTATDMDS